MAEICNEKTALDKFPLVEGKVMAGGALMGAFARKLMLLMLPTPLSLGVAVSRAPWAVDGGQGCGEGGDG